LEGQGWKGRVGRAGLEGQGWKGRVGRAGLEGGANVIEWLQES
jgi:hypothetical protein